MTFEQKIEKAKKDRIYLQDDLLKEEIVGVYGFFVKKGNAEPECFYIGKATNMRSRLLGSRGHLHYYLNGNFSKLVPQKMKDYHHRGYEIEVRLLVNFDGHDEDTSYEDTVFSKAAHRLALAEIQQIVKYQKLGQCLEQRPEGAGKNAENYWKNNYMQSKNQPD